MSIVNDPPEPAGAGHRYTVIYSYKHGYTYKPAIETLFNITTPPPATSYSTPYFLDWTALAAKTVDDYARCMRWLMIRGYITSSTSGMAAVVWLTC
jgi:hypothetical protein